MSLLRRLQLFFYGNGNLIGLALALLGPVLLFAGVIGVGWGWYLISPNWGSLFPTASP